MSTERAPSPAVPLRRLPGELGETGNDTISKRGLPVQFRYPARAQTRADIFRAFFLFEEEAADRESRLSRPSGEAQAEPPTFKRTHTGIVCFILETIGQTS